MSDTDDFEELDRAARALQSRLKSPDASFTERVMMDVRKEPRHGSSRALEPRVVRLRPWFVPLAAAALFGVWLLGTRYGASHAPAPAPAVAAAPTHDTVYVRFEFAAPAARQVHVAGDFNGWNPDDVPMSRSASGVWTATIPIVVGVHSYQFVVDGANWTPDPAVGGTDDGFGSRNSVVVVGPKGVVKS